MKSTELTNGAIISPCTRYRYRLWRECVGARGTMLFVLLNPSTADATHNDATVRRCIWFAARHRQYDRMEIVNLFAYRATNPRDLRPDRTSDPIGPENNDHILDAASSASVIVCAWGAHGTYLGRGMAVRHLLRAFHDRLLCFGVTKEGQPKHPLYLRADAQLHPWGAA